MTASAANRVLDTPELLEMILLQCSTAEITRARQISSFVKTLIDRSKSLRRAMFLETSVKPSDSSDINSFRFNIHPVFKSIQTCTCFSDNVRWDSQRGGFDVRDFLSWPRGSWEKMFINGVTPCDGVNITCRFVPWHECLPKDATLGDLRRFLQHKHWDTVTRDMDAAIALSDRRSGKFTNMIGALHGELVNHVR